MPRTKGTIGKDPFAAMVKHSTKLWTPHVAPDGKIWTITRSALSPTREEIIAGVMAVKVQRYKDVDGRAVKDGPARYPTRAEAERFAPTIKTDNAA